MTIQNPSAGAFPYIAFIKMLLSTSEGYKKNMAFDYHGFTLDSSPEMDEVGNDGWNLRAEAGDGSAVLTLMAELPLDVASSCKGAPLIYIQ